jgi:hypothetical protein
MIASAILVIVIASIYSVWYSILRGARIGSQAAESVQRARIAMRAIEDALSTSQMFILNGRHYTFEADTTTDPDLMSLSLVSRLPASYPGSAIFGDLAVRRVTFTVEPGTNGVPELLLRQVPVMMATNEVGQEYAIRLAQDVKFFRMEFYDAQLGEWIPEWQNTNQIPRTVRIALALGSSPQQPDRPAQLMTRVVTVPSSAVLPQYQMSAPGTAGGGPLPPGAPPPPVLPNDQNNQLNPGDRFDPVLPPRRQ